MFTHKTILFGLLIVAALLAAYLTAGNQPLRAALGQVGDPRPTVTAPALEIPASEPTAAPATTLQAVGTFVAPDQAALAFKIGGQIVELRAQEGAVVRKGDTLAVLDATSLQLQVQQAQAALAGARARFDQAKSPATTADTAAVQAALDAALKNYEKVRAGPTANDLGALKAQVDNAQAALNQAQAAYDRVGGASNPNIGMLPQSLQLQTATNNYRAALSALTGATTHPSPSELAAAWQQVQQAQDALSRLEPNSNNVAEAQAQVDQAQAALDLAQQQVANATLIAPFDGTVIRLESHTGKSIAATMPVLVLADLTHLQLVAGVDQNLLEQIQVGQMVSIVPDAFKDKPVTGKVSRIGWLATTTAGMTSVPVTIDVGATAVPLRPGLTATVEFNTAQ